MLQSKLLKIMSIVCSAVLSVSSIEVYSKNTFTTDNNDSFSKINEEDQTSNSDRSNRDIQKQNTINTFLSKTSGWFPKNKNKKIKCMLDTLSLEKLEVLKDLNFKSPYKELLKRLIPIPIVPYFLSSDYDHIGVITECLTLSSVMVDVTKGKNLFPSGLIVGLTIGSRILYASAGFEDVRSANYQLLKSIVPGKIS